jgi:hypothetical protein
MGSGTRTGFGVNRPGAGVGLAAGKAQISCKAGMGDGNHYGSFHGAVAKHAGAHGIVRRTQP